MVVVRASMVAQTSDVFFIGTPSQIIGTQSLPKTRINPILVCRKKLSMEGTDRNSVFSQDCTLREFRRFRQKTAAERHDFEVPTYLVRSTVTRCLTDAYV